MIPTRMSVQPEAVARTSWRHKVARSKLLRAAVTLGLLAIVGAQLHPHAVVRQVSHGHVDDMVLALLLIVLALIVGALRWARLLRIAGIRLSIGEVGRIYALATFSGTFLPATVGADFARALLVARRGRVLTQAAVTIVVDRAGALYGMLALTWVAELVRPATVPRGAIGFLTVVTAGAVIGGGLITVATVMNTSALHQRLPSRIKGVVDDSSTLIRTYLSRPDVLALTLLTSVVFQALVTEQVVVLGDAIGVHISFATAAVALTVVTLATLLPISVGGFGVREGTYVTILGATSVNATSATLISLLTVVTLFAASLPGAVLLARRGLAPALVSHP